ncbi:MAG: oligosaccharide flippase family protein [Pseudomonas sp.]|nr:oligosaccharide flippase family protein [Pseudomonas sp.]
MKKLSVVHNTTLSYLGQAYSVLVGILIMPFYLGHLGAEVYGLIGFFAVLQAWLMLLDAGMSPSLVRQIAHQQSAGDVQRISGWLLRSFEIVFLPLAVLCCIAVYLVSPWIAGHWLNAQSLDHGTLVACVALMGPMVALRLYSTLYKSGLQGLEMHAWLNAANVLIATLRYFGGLALVAWVSKDALVFFQFQLAVTLIETLLFAAKAYARLPAPHWFSGFNSALVKPVLPFALSLSGTSILWIVLTQLDKVLLSSSLTLKEYGYFSLVAMISTGIVTLVNPLVQTLLPRMTALMAEGREGEMQQLYLGANRFICTLLFPLGAMIAVHGGPLIFAWSGDQHAADWAAPLMLWYALGAAILAANGFQFYLQYAHGRMRLHVWFSVVSALVTVPVLVAAVHYQGAMGAAVAWFLLRLVSFAIWPQMIHQRLAPGIHGQWLHDMLRITLMTAVGVLLTLPLVQLFTGPGRLQTLFGLALAGVIVLVLVAGSDKPLVQKILFLLTKPSAQR